MKKKVILLSLAMMLLLTGVVSAATLWGKYKGYAIMKITVDGQPVKTDVPAIVFDNRTMVPVYLLKEAGINYSLDSDKQKVNISSKSSNTPNTSFDPTAATKEIISLGGVGVTIMTIDRELTALVHFDQQVNFDADWPKLSNIFTKLIPFNATYSRIEYYINGQSSGAVEIKTKDYKDFLSGTISSSQLDKKWLLLGPMFEGSNNTGNSNGNGSKNTITYPELYSNDLKTYLGKLTSNSFDVDSVFNSYGSYGSSYSTTSIFNEYGTYGGSYSIESSFNKFATKPPVIVLNGKIIGYLTLNTTIKDAVSPAGLQKWLEKQGY